MAENVQLDYAAPDSATTPFWRRHSTVFLCCVGISWASWFVIALATYDPFDDGIAIWLMFLPLAPGSLCGVLFYAIYRVLAFVRRRSTRSLPPG